MKMYGMKIMVFGDEFITIDEIHKFVTSHDSLKYFDKHYSYLLYWEIGEKKENYNGK